MNILEELKDVLEVRVNTDALADKIFDKGVDKVMLKLTKLIPTQFDDVLYAANKETLKAAFREALAEGLDFVEEKTGIDLDGEEEKSDEEVSA